MTITINTVVTDAMRNVNMMAAGQNPSGEEAAEALRTLNDMMLSLPATGVHTGWTELDLTDDFPLEDRHIEGVKWMLSEALVPANGMSLTREQQGKATNGRLLLEADYKILERLRVDGALAAMPSQRLVGR
jgi:hypothetical protein